MTRSTSTTGSTLDGSPPARAIADRIAARSTTAGTPVKSCIRTRDGMNARSADGTIRGQSASARTSSWRDVAGASAAQEVLEQDLDGVRQPVEVRDGREPVQLDRPLAGDQSVPGGERVAHRLMLSDASSKLGDRPAMGDARLATDLGFALTALLLVRLGDQRRDRSRLALLVESDEHEIRARRVRPRPGLELLGFDTDADLAARSCPRRSRMPSPSRCRRRGSGRGTTSRPSRP